MEYNALKRRFTAELKKGKKRLSFSDDVLAASPKPDDVFRINATDRALSRLFQEHGYDPKKAEGWRLLLEAFAKAFYANPGSPVVWDRKRVENFLEDIFAAQQLLPLRQQLKFSKVAHVLRTEKQFKAEYKHMKPDSLSRAASTALAAYKAGRLINPWTKKDALSSKSMNGAKGSRDKSNILAERWNSNMRNFVWMMEGRSRS